MNEKKISYYGKIPLFGDYIFDNAPMAFKDVWHDWLESSLRSWRGVFREAMHEDWVAAYLTMKPYRFVLSAGIAGEVIWCGIVLPSRDKPGRLFPFTLCVPFSPTATSPIQVYQQCRDWLDRLESLAINCLTKDFDLDDFEGVFQKGLNSLLQELPDIQMSSAYSCASNDNQTCNQPSFAWHCSCELNHDNVNDLTQTLLQEFCHSYSLWWTKGDTDFMVCQGLPPSEIIPAFIDGNWKGWGWLDGNTSQERKINGDDTVANEDTVSIDLQS